MKALIIDDDPSITEVIKISLNKQKINCDIAYGGHEGIDYAESFSYSVIILDLMMPEVNGFAVLEKLRGHGNHTPIIVVTAKGKVEDKLKSFRLGADDYLMKPFYTDELIERIKAITRRYHEKPALLHLKGDLTIDFTHRIASVGDEMLILTNKEFDVLEFLAKRKGRIVSTADLLSFLYPTNEEPYAETIRQFVSRLRRKLSLATDGNSIIETVYGEGYLIS